MRRAIRLKEYAASTEIVHRPPDWYIAARDRCLEQRDYMMRTDANGFILPRGDIDAAAPTVIVMGDSVVEGMFVAPEHRMCSVLQDRCRQTHGIAINVLNAGYSGATLLHLFNLLVNKIIPLRPAAVVLMTGIVDVDVSYKRTSFWSRDCWLEPIIDVEANNEWRDNDNLPERDLEDRARLLRLFLSACDAFALPVALATVPHRQLYVGEYVGRAFPRRDEFDKEVRDRRAMNAVTRSAAIKMDIPLFDLELDLVDRTDIFYDMFHHNQHGGDAVARGVLRFDEAFLRRLTQG